MKRLNNFNDYILDLILEGSDTGNLPIKFSKKLTDILSQINHRIASSILSLEDESGPITLIDISDENDKLTITNSLKAIEFLSKQYNKSEITNRDFYLNTNMDIWNMYRNKIKIGKLIKKLFGDEFPDSGKKGTDIESFVNKYKSLYGIMFNDSDKLFEIVDGKDIIKWYNQENYYSGIDDSPLHNSCMAEDCDNYLKFYAKNSDKVKMLIQYKDDKKNKIIGRSLLWHLSKPKRIFMDRIYYIMDHQIETFINYATKNGWLYKKEQSHYDSTIIDSKTNKIYDGSVYITDIKPNRHYPYLDTLFYYYQDNHILSNDDDIQFEYQENPVPLRETDGTSSGSYWSNFYKKYITEGDDNYIECELLTDDDDKDDYEYVNDKLRLKKDCTYFKYYGDYAPNDRLKDEEIIETTFGEKYKIFKYDAIWLKHYNAYTTSNYTEYGMIYSLYYNDYIDKKDFIVSYNNDNIFKDKSTLVYRKEKNNENELDALYNGNAYYVPNEELDEVAYKKDGKYIFKKGVL